MLLDDCVFVAPLWDVQVSTPYSRDGGKNIMIRMMRIILELTKMIKLVKLINMINMIKTIKLIKIIKMINKKIKINNNEE